MNIENYEVLREALDIVPSYEYNINSIESHYFCKYLPSCSFDGIIITQFVKG